ncbi:MAG: hypothetical protein V3573_10020 [Desulfovibrionaceae bacterium]
MRLQYLALICVLAASLGMGHIALAQEQTPDAVQNSTQNASQGEALSDGSANGAALTPEEAAAKKKEEAQIKMASDFSRFSDTWVARLNRSHSNGYGNMHVVQDGGVYRARYHRIEKRSSVVRESPSQPGHYCGILRYHDTLYESVGQTREESLAGEFIPVSGTARAFSEIFQYSKGAWK